MKIRKLPELTAAARVRAGALTAAANGARADAGRYASPALAELLAEAEAAAALLTELELHHQVTAR